MFVVVVVVGMISVGGVGVVSVGVVSEVQWVDCVCMSIVLPQLNSIEHMCVSHCLHGLSSQPI
jgi:hypothetical protein